MAALARAPTPPYDADAQATDTQAATSAIPPATTEDAGVVGLVKHASARLADTQQRLSDLSTQQVRFQQQLDRDFPEGQLFASPPTIENLERIPEYQKRAAALQKRMADVAKRAAVVRKKSDALAKRAEADAAKKAEAAAAAASAAAKKD